MSPDKGVAEEEGFESPVSARTIAALGAAKRGVNLGGLKRESLAHENHWEQGEHRKRRSTQQYGGKEERGPASCDLRYPHQWRKHPWADCPCSQ